MIFAHRGAHSKTGEGPIENTLPAFLAAKALGVPIEYDLQECKSGELVVFHDEELESGPVKKFSLREKSWRRTLSFRRWWYP